MDSASGATGLIAPLATLAWRLQRRFADPTVSGEEPVRRAARDVQAMLDLLQEHSVEIQDHTGAAYDPSLSLRVVAFQPTPDLAHECVLETLKPTVYYRRQRIQIGEVIVG